MPMQLLVIMLVILLKAHLAHQLTFSSSFLPIYHWFFIFPTRYGGKIGGVVNWVAYMAANPGATNQTMYAFSANNTVTGVP